MNGLFSLAQGASILPQTNDLHDCSIGPSDYRDTTASAPVLSMQLIENAVTKMKKQNPLM